MDKIAVFLRESGTARFFIPAGLILLIFGVVLFVVNTKNQNYIKTEATVLESKVLEEAHTDVDGNYVDATYSATFKYSVDGKEYTGSLDNVSKFNAGDKMTIYYNPENPSQITQTKSLMLPVIIIAAGIASLVGGIISAANAIKKYNKMKEQERSWNNEQ